MQSMNNIDTQSMKANNIQSMKNFNMTSLKISIIGLGLIGGSLARAFNERLGFHDIIAVDDNRESLEQALRDRNISGGFCEINSHVWNSDIIFICTPVRRAVEYLKILADKVKPGSIITDVCSTKAEIVNFANSLINPPCFIGGHPMAGAEKSGYGASYSHLFENAYYVLCPGRAADSSSTELISNIVKGIGAIPIIMDADEHDRITGAISHLPHVIAAALVNMVKNLDDDRGIMKMLAAGGFRDITRIASSSPEMWENIVMSNSGKLKDLIDTYVDLLLTFKNSIKPENSQSIQNFFRCARDYRDSLPERKKGLLEPLHEIVVDVIDRPGVIGEVATILGKGGINIKNINVTNSREFEQGCLRITLPDAESVDLAIRLLGSAGYRVYKNNVL